MRISDWSSDVCSSDLVDACDTAGGNQVNAYREKAEGLGAEESTQYSVGVVWDATDWMNITVDYWNIEIEDRIAYFGSQKLINIDNGDDPTPMPGAPCSLRSEEHTSELQSLMRISYAVFCLKK